MSKTIGFNLNNEEILKVCNNFKIREEELGRTIKRFVLSEGSFNQHRDLKTNKPEDMVVEKSLTQIKREIPDMTIAELEEALKVGKEKHNVIDKKGLYTEINVETYLKKFIREWDHNMDKIPECMAQLKIFCAEEMLATAYTERITSV